MSLFKVLRGSEANLPITKTDGWAYFCTDTGSFWVDHQDTNNTLVRSKISANFADKLRYVKDGETVELDPSEIATTSALDTHIDSNIHIKSDERTKWNEAKTHAESAHAPSNAEKNQNAFSNIKVGTATIAADTTTDTITLEGSNITITPDATNDKITFSVANGTTSEKGIVQLTDSKSSTSTTTAATPNSVRVAYNLAQEAKTTADKKADASHTHTVSDITDLTVTTTELNYIDGVTSNVQAQLDGKVDKVNGKGLSANDYTTTEKNKLADIEVGANKYVLPSATDAVVGGMNLYTSTGTNTTGTMTQKAITDALAGKSGTGHNHDSVYSELGHTHTAAEVGATTQVYVDNQIEGAKSYTDTKVAELVDSAPEALNTLNDLAAALGDDPNFATTIATELGKKATTSALNAHIQSDVHLASGERTKWDNHADSAHAPSNAERNIIVGIQKNGTDVSVDSNRKVNITVPTKTSELTNNSDFATNVSVTSAKNALQANIDTHTENKNNPHGVTAAQVGAAPVTHEHNATDITDGILPVSRGGTGNNAGYVRVGQKAGTAIGTKATIEGTENTASGDYSHVEGSYSKAIGNSSHAEGKWTTSSGDWSHAEGNNTKTGGTSPASLGADAPASGLAAHAEGYGSVARAGYSHAEGNGTVADGVAAHSEGQSTKASGNYAHAEGLKSTASGVGSHAEGDLTEAIGGYSHAEGAGSVARGNYTHAEGYATTASGAYSHSEGYSTTAAGESSHVQGKYNIADSSGTYAHIVGNGTADDARSNAHTLDWEGNAWFAGNISSENSAPTVKLKNTDGGNTGYLLMGTGALVDAGVQISSSEDTRLRIGRYSNGKPCLTIFHKVNGAGTYYDVYNKYSHPNIASTASVTTAAYKTMAANNELEETTLYMLTDDTEEEDLQATVNEMNNIDYEANLAFDVNEIV